MSKGKQLLNEQTVKRFMKLAGTEKLYENVELEEQGKLKSLGTIDSDIPASPDLGKKKVGKYKGMATSGPESLDPEYRKLDEQMPGEEELPPEDLDLAPEGPPPEGLEPELGEEGDVGVEGALRDVLDAVAAVAADHGVDVDVEGEEGEEELDFEPLEGEEGAFPPAGGEEEMPPGLEEARAHYSKQVFMEELSRRVANRVKKEHIVEQVTKRVARRLQATKRRTRR